MKATLLAEDFARLTRLAADAADPFATGARRNVRIDALGDALGVIAHGGALGVMAEAPAEVHVPGTASVPADRLHELVTKFGKGAVTIERLPNCHVALARAKGKTTRTLTLAGDHPDDAATVPERPAAAQWVALPRGALAVAVREVLYAASRIDNYSQPHLRAVRVEVADQRLVAFATDGVRAACREVPVPVPGELAATLPERLCEAVAKGLFGRLKKGDAELDAEGAGALRLELAVGERSVWLRDADAGVTAAAPRLVGEYPAWRGLEAQYGPLRTHVAELDRAAWLDAAAALAAVDSRDGRDVVMLTFVDGVLAMRAEGTAESGGSDSVEAAHGDHACGAATNARYLHAALARWSTERVRVAYGEPNVPLLIEPVTADLRAPAWALVMPMVRS